MSLVLTAVLSLLRLTVGCCWDVAASWERKQEITAAHTYFELGSFYYLANDPQVPANVRATYQKYGLCADGEFEPSTAAPALPHAKELSSGQP